MAMSAAPKVKYRPNASSLVPSGHRDSYAHTKYWIKSRSKNQVAALLLAMLQVALSRQWFTYLPITRTHGYRRTRIHVRTFLKTCSVVKVS